MMGSFPFEDVCMTGASLAYIGWCRERMSITKVGVHDVARPIAWSTFYPCRLKAGHHILHTRKALGQIPVTITRPIFRTVTV